MFYILFNIEHIVQHLALPYVRKLRCIQNPILCSEVTLCSTSYAVLILYTLFNIEHIVQHLTLYSEAVLHSESDTMLGSHFVFNILHCVNIVYLIQY